MPLTSYSAGRTLTPQEALNAIAQGIARSRSTDFYATDVKGSTLALSVTNASKAIPAGVLGVAFWCASDFRWRLGAAADLVDGAYAKANDVIATSFDPDAIPTTIQAILASETATLYINWLYGV